MSNRISHAQYCWRDDSTPLKSKWTELLNALRLEAHFSKEEILEFCANQFHVSSNGRGLGIAARYFFDKDVTELSTLECAFLAGLVKAPSRYNPFVGKTEEQLKANGEAPKVIYKDKIVEKIVEVEKVVEKIPHKGQQLFSILIRTL
mgnify:CR=1 FL=1